MSSDAESKNNDFQQQVNTYVAWVNSQLKKKPLSTPVRDLRTDFSDGVLLVDLLEIISGEKLQDVRVNATKYDDKLHNVNLILKFLNSKNIRIHHVTDKDIIDGNVKSTMRLILTLAAHFKPASVGSRKSVSTAAVANANAALSHIHDHVTSPSSHRRWKSSTPSDNRTRTSHQATRKNGDGYQSGSLSAEESFVNLIPSTDSNNSLSFWEGHSLESHRMTPLRSMSSINSEVILESSGKLSGDTEQEQLSVYHDELRSDLSSTKDLVSMLQHLLLNGEIPDQNESDEGGEKCMPLQALSGNEDSLIVQSQLDISRHENSRLKSELADARQECRAACANKSAMNSRYQQQDKELVSLRQNMLKMNFTNENLHQDKEYLEAEISTLKRANQALSSDLTDKNMTVKHLRDQMDLMSSQVRKFDSDRKHKRDSVQQLEMQVRDLKHQIKTLQRYKQSNPQGNETAIIKESLNSLRGSLSPQDARRHILDTLEQSFKSLSESVRKSPAKSPYRPKKDFVMSPSMSNSPRTRHGREQRSDSTSIIYFYDSNMTPFRGSINKKIGEITLKDVKSILHTSDQYTFNFKALDPEFGTVKKEVVHENDIVPGWEGKIVAWLDKMHENGNQ